MTSLSQKFVLICMLFQLCFSVPPFKTNQPEFGDILVFSTRGLCGEKIANHYAIFVGDEKIEGKHDDNANIFDMLKYGDDGSSSSISSRKAGTSGCAFRHLDLKNVTVHNYLDDKVKPEKEKIIAALVKMNKDCGEWSLTNTCEHIATSIRYGEANATCKQKGTSAAAICPFINLITNVQQLLNASKQQRAVAEAA